MGHEAFHPSHIRTFAFQSRYHGLLPRNGGENLEELPHKLQKAIHFSEVFYRRVIRVNPLQITLYTKGSEATKIIKGHVASFEEQDSKIRVLDLDTLGCLSFEEL